MSDRVHGTLGSKMLLLFLLVLCFAGLAIYGSGQYEALLDSIRSKPKAVLNSAVHLQGAVTMQDMKFSQREIRQLNRSILRHNRSFNRVDLNINMPPAFEEPNVGQKTKLVMVMQLKADECVIQSWPEEILRAEIVPNVTRYMDLAAEEMPRYLESPEFKGRFNKIYM